LILLGRHGVEPPVPGFFAECTRPNEGADPVAGFVIYGIKEAVAILANRD
jgi:hypothetical protein